jgi:hypothetical protein
MYSKVLYMKTRVTFRVEAELAEALRELPNQTQFVEQAVREALRTRCPLCGGSGRLGARRVRVPNFRSAKLPALRRDEAVHLRRLVGVARRAAATSLDLHATGQGLVFAMLSERDVLLEGTLGTDGAGLPTATGGR